MAAAHADQQLFLVEAHNGADTLLRVLGCFAVQQAELVETHSQIEGERLSMRIVVQGLSPSRVDQLRRRIGELPMAASVSVGWRPRAA
jgi:hypothetical protein